MVCLFAKFGFSEPKPKGLIKYLWNSKRYGPVFKKLVLAHQEQNITMSEMEEEVCLMSGRDLDKREKLELTELLLLNLQRQIFNN
jgi:hypothetical protein